MHKESLERLGITEVHMKQLFPYVNFVKTTSTPTWKASAESGLQVLSDDNWEPQKRKRKPSVPKS
jgi:hypothetical protein